MTSTAAASASDPEEMLRRSTRAFFEYLERNSPAWTIMRSESAVAGEALEGIRAQQTDFVATLLAAQAPGADAARLQGWALAVVGACERLALWRRRDRAVIAEQATEYLMDLVWSGLAGAAQSSR